jgi:hypothetical protein
MVFSHHVRNLMNILIVYAFISSSRADIPAGLTIKSISNFCTAVIQANGSVALIEIVSNISVTTISIWNGFNFTQSFSFIICTQPMIDIQLQNSNVSINLNQKEMLIQSINLTASSIKFQNGTFNVGSSILVPESSVMELDNAILFATTIYQQVSLTIQGTLFFVSLALSDVFVPILHARDNFQET